MYDAFLQYSHALKGSFLLEQLDGTKCVVPEDFYYLTCHREENTNDTSLLEIFKAMDSLDAPVVYPVHPRNKARAKRLCTEKRFENIILAEPVGYLESIYLVNHAKKIVTDSGGLQREAFFAKKKCVTILDFVCWPETMIYNRNVLSKPKAEAILSALSKGQRIDPDYKPFGDGRSAKKIVECIEEYGG